MTCVVFGNDLGLARLGEVTPAVGRHLVADSWDALLTLGDRVDLLVLLLAPTAGGSWEEKLWVSRLHELRYAHPAAPLLLVVSYRRSWMDFLARIGDVRVHETAFWSETAGELRGHVERAKAYHLSTVLAKEFESEYTSPRAQDMIRSVVARCPPFANVEELAQALHIARRTLNLRWKRDGCIALVGNPKNLVDWTLLAHACYRKNAHNTWTGIAPALRISLDRLRNIALRQTGRSLRGLEGLPPALLPRPAARASGDECQKQATSGSSR